MKQYINKYMHERVSCLAGSLTILIMLFMTTSCKKFVSIDPPSTSLTPGNVFTDAASIKAAVAGIYSYTFRTTPLFNTGDWHLGILADEIYYRTSGFDVLRYNTLSANDLLAANFWVGPYAVIFQANSLIENLPGSNVIANDVKEQYIAEAKFFRAYAHMMLASFYGNVPLTLTTDVNLNSLAPRTAKDLVYQAIISDLSDAEKSLTTGSGNNRVTRAAAQALLARAYLFRGDWVNAEAKASAVIKTNSYTLLTNLNQVFLRGSKEAILQYSSSNPGGTYDGYLQLGANMLPTSSNLAPNTIITTSLLQSFEPGDLRKSSWINSSVVSNVTYFYPYKYKLRTSPASAAQAEEYVVLRLGEQYLIRAEARARLNLLPEATADLNVIRTRAGLANLPVQDQATVILSVEKEKRNEMFQNSLQPADRMEKRLPFRKIYSV